MSDSFTEVSTEGWFSRIGGAIKGIVIGVLMCLGAVVLLWWNEGRSVERYQSLKEGEGVVVSVGHEKVDPANEGKLIHVSGLATTDETLKDDQFGVEVQGLKLRREAEMYQWKETTSTEKVKKLGGKEETRTTYSYSREWSSSLVDSSNFNQAVDHRNPGTIPVESNSWVAKTVTLGAFAMTPSLVAQIGNWENIAISGNAEIPDGVPAKMKVANGGYYIGTNPGSPEVGDVRVTFKKVMPSEVSVISKQIQGSFEPFLAKAGGEVELLEAGVQSAEAMIAAAQASNRMLMWVLRLVGFVLMAFGLGLILRPFQVVADVLPFAGSIVGMGIGFVSFVVAAIVSLLVIAVAWIFYRPLLGISLLVVVAALVVWLVMRKKKRVPAVA